MLRLAFRSEDVRYQSRDRGGAPDQEVKLHELCLQVIRLLLRNGFGEKVVLALLSLEISFGKLREVGLEGHVEALGVEPPELPDEALERLKADVPLAGLLHVRVDVHGVDAAEGLVNAEAPSV